MRIFLSIFPTKEFKDYFRDVVRELDKQKRNLRPVNLENIHFTVRFFGSRVSPRTKKLLVDEFIAMQGSFPKPEIKIEKLQMGFKRQKDPRIIMAMIEPNRELKALMSSIHKIVRDTKKHDLIRWQQTDLNSFHITIARMKPNASRSTGKDIKEMVENIGIEYPEPFTASFMQLMESKITPKGPVYTKLEQIIL